MNATRRPELEQDVDRGPLNWLALVLAVVLAGFQLYLGREPTMEGAMPVTPSTLLGVVLLAGAVLFFTSYWRPTLYLAGTLAGLYVVVLWVLGPTVLDPATVGNAIVAVLFALACLGSFYRERVAYLTQ